MKKVLVLSALAALTAAAACVSSTPEAQYANPVEACENKPTIEERDECMKNVVADVAASVKRESQRKPPR
jgi:Na+-transporting methylmalonyl-CoA/oxaloacetate decarboxylase gamma subunit